VKTIIQFMNDEGIFGTRFRSKSWANWKVFLKVLFCLPLSIAEMNIYKRAAGRDDLPREQPSEAYLVVGRRGGKSIVCALIGAYLATCRDYAKYRAPGEQLVVMLLAQDRSAARVLFSYCRAFFDLPMLATMVVNQRADSIELSNGVSVEIHTSDYRAVRGRTVVAMIGDELAFWPASADGSASDKEVLDAVRPAMATIPGSLLICLSSPYSKRGELYRNYAEHFGKAGAPVLIWQSDSRTMNPTLSHLKVAYEHLRDPVVAKSEWDAEFRADLSSFISPELLDYAMQSWASLAPLGSVHYHAFVDAAGGCGSDSFACAIAHFEAKSETVVVDCVKEIAPPFSPDSATAEIVDLLRAYRIGEIRGDRYAGSWPEERFAARGGIVYRVSELNRSELYLEFLPALTANRCQLPNSTKLKNQLTALERKTGRAGRDTVDHGVGSHDDLSNVIAGVVVEVLRANGAFGSGGFVELLKQLAEGKHAELLDPMAAYNKPPDPGAAVSTETICAQCGGPMRQTRANDPGWWCCSACGHAEARSRFTQLGVSRGEYLARLDGEHATLGRGSFGRFGRR